jgi:hypothetical protein
MSDDRSGRRREAAIAALLAAVAALLYLPTAPFYFRPDDDGLAIYDALLILQGRRPFLDFFVHDSPFVSYWNALALQLGGVDMLTLRYALVPFKVLLVPAIYLLARPAAGRPAAIVAALMVFMADSGVAFGMPHPGWYGLALSLLGLLAMRAWLTGGRARWLPAAGAAFGLAIAAKQNLGLFIFGACALLLLEPIAPALPAGAGLRGRAGDARPLWGARALAWLVVLAGLLYMLRDQFRPDVLVLLWLPVAALAAVSVGPLPPAGAASGALAAAARRVAWLTLGMAATLGPWLLALGLLSGFDKLIPGLLIVPSELPRVMFFPYKVPPPEFWQVTLLVTGAPLLLWLGLRAAPRRPALAVALAGAWLLGALALLVSPALGWQGIVFSWYYAPPALIWLALLLRRRAGAGDPPAPGALYDRFLLLAAAFGMLQLYPLMDRVHGAWSYPFTLPLLALALDRAPAALLRRLPAAARAAPGARRALAAALLVLPLFWTYYIATWRLGLWWDVPASLAGGRVVGSLWQPLGLPHASLYAYAPAPEQFRGATGLLRARARPDEPIFAFPNEQAFYVMAERPAATAHTYLLPGVTPPEEQAAVIADLERAGTRYVIMFRPASSLGSLAPVATYLAAHYQPVADFGDYSVMERK